MPLTKSEQATHESLYNKVVLTGSYTREEAKLFTELDLRAEMFGYE